MELTLQTKLLSLLDTQDFRRIGAVAPTKVDVRFIAATNRILLTEVKEGRFRNDLYYRLQIVAINLPPLRERGEDVLLLTDYFIRRLNVRYDRTITGLDAETREIFLKYRWPGNVRELENLLERNFILEEDNTIRAHHLPDRILRSVGARSVSTAEPWSVGGDGSRGRRAARRTATSTPPPRRSSASCCGGRSTGTAAMPVRRPRRSASRATRCATRCRSSACSDFPRGCAKLTPPASAARRARSAPRQRHRTVALAPPLARSLHESLSKPDSRTVQCPRR
jgi:DNA-binding NtrC family response regulator